jgi:hypothetical protein
VGDSVIWERLENIIMIKMEEMNSHYCIKILKAIFKSKQCSGQLYDTLVNRLLQPDFLDELKYSDAIDFFEIFPHITYIFENNMTPELYEVFMSKMAHLMRNKKMPIADVARVFTIAVKISPYDTNSGEIV